MNNHRFWLAGMLLFFAGFLQAQAVVTGTITGKITDPAGKPVEGATVMLLPAKDSVIRRTALTDANGHFLLEKITQGQYRVKVAMTGFAPVTTDVFALDAASKELAVITLTPQSGNLQGVTVTAQKPMVERKIDRTVVNVESMITAAGGTAMDVLEKSPGISVDQNGVVSLRGKTGVVIFIDDKPTYLSGADLESYLRSLPSSSIDQIEIMTNPPARYDAAGGAGVINIRTKRTRVVGFNGSLNTGFIQGRYPKTTNSLNVNYRHNKWNTFATVTVNTNIGFSDLDINRHFLNPNGTRKSDFLQHTYIKSGNTAATAKIGADYYATEKTTLGVVLTGVTRGGYRNNDNESRILNAAYQLDSTITAHNKQDNTFRNGGINLNYRHQYRKQGPELTADADYIRYNTGNDQVFNNFTYLANGTLSNQDRLDGNLPARINIYSGKIDYSHPFTGGIKLDMGVKSSHTETDNIAEYYHTVGGVTSPDYDKTNHFIYKETIHAAYINSSREFSRWSFQVGLRAEHTVSDGRQLGNAVKPDSSFRRTYTSLFPTAYVNVKLDSAGRHVLTLDYGRRINRPYYQDLNPFISPLDKFTYYVGNPFLLPSYNHNVELSYNYRNMFTVAASFSQTRNNTNETIEIVNGTYYSRPGNIGTVTTKSVSLNGNRPVTKWLTVTLYTELTNIHSESNFYTGRLDTKGTFWFVQPNLQFKLGKGWNVQVDGIYQTDVISAQFRLRERGRVNLGISKKLSDAFSIRFAANDLFYTQVNRGVINNLANTLANWRNANDTRTFGVALGWRFGKAINNLRKHNASASETEQGRVKD